MNRKAVLIDFDGTLVDSLKAVYEVFKAYFEMKGKTFMSPREFERAFKSDWMEFLREHGIAVEGGGTAIDGLVNRYISLVSQAGVEPSMVQALKSLKDLGFKVAVVSSSMEEAIDSKLKSEDIEVDLIVSGFESRISDKTKLIKSALEKLKIDPRDAVYIGDMKEDVEACKKLGVKVIGYAKDVRGKKALEAAGADSVILNGKPLIKIVTEILKE
ncbi:MAG: HAD-IA family hydrolase [Candidatus Bathyarchaeia archaeon]|nr:HAD-IA family hydrolase [Candidatus Bathyarchaeota archaeon]